MGTPTTFTTLIRLGLDSLEDRTPLTTPRTWFRNGERGNLHLDPACYKYNGRYNGGVEVELTAEQVAGKKQCDDCCTLYRLTGNEISQAITALHTVRQNLANVDVDGIGSRVGTFGHAVMLAKQSRHELDRLSEQSRDAIENAYRTCHEELEQHERILRDRTDTVRAATIPWAVSMLLKHEHSGTSKAPPAATETDLVLYGAADRHSYELGRLFERWLVRRRKGPEKAAETLVTELADCRLTSPGQLAFTLRGSIEQGEDLVEAATAAWRDEIRSRLDERLVPAWEALWQDASADTGPSVVGFHTSFVRTDTEGLLASYPHRYTNDRRHVVVAVPRVVGRWLTVGEKRWNRAPELVDIPDSDDVDLLDTVAGLWDPTAVVSTYQTLGDAVAAARQLG